MKTYLLKVFSFTAIFTFLFNSFAFGQTEQNNQAQAQINDLTNKSGAYFKSGINALQDGMRQQAGDNFDKSLEVFLYSTVNVQRNQKLSDCYNQLVETIYRIEFPSNQQPPNIRSLSATCGWNITNEVADNVAKLVLTVPTNETNTNNGLITAAVTNNSTQGFQTQEFTALQTDELAQLPPELTEEEKRIETNNPVAQQQYQQIQVAVQNRSLGFNFQFNPMIQQYINHFQGRGRGTMETGLYRSGMFMRMARRIFREEGVPENIAWLGQVESMWKPTAQSWAAASGLWQFIPGTGARYGLRRTAYLDERNSFEQATQASARYLKFLANRYNGNWELGMAAYNCGEGNVDRAISRAGVADFWRAYSFLPQETRNYVPMILATILIANNPVAYGFGNVRPAPQLAYDRIRVPALTSLSLIAQASDTTVEYIRFLNPEFRTLTTPPEPYIVRVPAGKANEVVALFRKMPKTNTNNTALANTSKGETWENISARTGVSVQDLRAANGNAAVPGSKVIIPQKGNNVNNVVYSRPTNQPTTTTTTVNSNVRVVKAQRGDTVATLAAREKVSVDEVAKFNGLLPSTKLVAGREIRIPAAK
ncbi:MAG TPA: transglycosylase SLT domain-containing protein [Pyrinomonadaceae bacterium]|nr:transglycosylase SLT domain-containing protein [Pyrinomonadaceae bacterium]